MTPRRPPEAPRAAGAVATVDPMPRRTDPSNPTTTPAPQLAIGAPELAGDAGPVTVDPLPELMTTAEVADALRISAYVVREYVARGVLPAYRVGRELRIPRESVARHLATLRINA